MGNIVSHVSRILRNSRINTPLKKLEYLIDILNFRLSRLQGHNTKLFGFKMHYDSRASLVHLIKESFIDFHYFVHLQKENPVIFDIGSNIGVTVLFFKKFYPESTVYSFEPNPDIFKLLRENILQNSLKDVFSYNAGMSNVKGRTKFYVPSWSSGSSSIFREKIEIEMEYAQTCTSSSRAQTNEKEVEIMRCSEFIRENGIKHIDLLKIDAEGAEEKIINDISEHLDIIDFIALEFHYTKDFINQNSLGAIIAKLEASDFIVSINPTWTSTGQRVMCTYLLKAVNGKSRDLYTHQLIRSF